MLAKQKIRPQIPVKPAGLRKSRPSSSGTEIHYRTEQNNLNNQQEMVSFKGVNRGHFRSLEVIISHFFLFRLKRACDHLLPLSQAKQQAQMLNPDQILFRIVQHVTDFRRPIRVEANELIVSTVELRIRTIQKLDPNPNIKKIELKQKDRLKIER